MVDDVSPDWPGRWAPLPAVEWAATRDTLHRWTQIVGKVRMACAPPVNHWWHVTLYADARGLTTGVVPGGPAGAFELAFDLVEHRLDLRRADGARRSIALEPRSVADFFAETTARLGELGIEPRILARPVEVEDATPFSDDRHHADYDPAAVRRFHANLVDAQRVLAAFRSRFTGKVSPVHFFWGAFDLAVTRFSGRPAPLHPGGAPNCADWVMHEAYSHEVSSAGWWPGGGDAGLLYAYAYPEPAGYAGAPVAPAAARYDADLREFVLPFEAAAAAADPDAEAAAFFEATHTAAATTGRWSEAPLPGT